jgi:hypothetical protein
MKILMGVVAISAVGIACAHADCDPKQAPPSVVQSIARAVITELQQTDPNTSGDIPSLFTKSMHDALLPYLPHKPVSPGFPGVTAVQMADVPRFALNPNIALQCFPELVKLQGDLRTAYNEIQQKAQEKVWKEQERVAAEQAKQAEEQSKLAQEHAERMAAEQAKRDEEQRKAAQAMRAKQAEETRRVANLPENRLFEAYWRYAHVQYCYKVREGYAMIYISDPELARAKTVAKAIENKILDEQPGLDTDSIWRKALGHNDGGSITDSSCKRTYGELVEMSPVGVFNMQKP